MSRLKELLEEAEGKTYAYRVKIAADCDASVTSVMESSLQKYDLIGIAPWNRSPIEHNPAAFLKYKNVRITSEVCDTDIELKYPVREKILEVYLAAALGIDLDRIICYGIKEARRVDNDILNARLQKNVDRKVSIDDSVMSEDETQDQSHYELENAEWIDDPILYGEAYNEKFLAELNKIKEEKGVDYFSNYPTKDELMGQNNWDLWHTLHNTPNMGMTNEDAKEVDVISQASRRN